MKRLVYILFLFLSTIPISKANAQKIHVENSKLTSIKITLQNRDSLGTRWRSYTLQNKKIVILDKPFSNSSYKEHLFTLRNFNLDVFKRAISNLNFDTLNSEYQNKCVDSIIGKRYIIEFNAGKFLKIVSLHEYYLDLINTLISHIND